MIADVLFARHYRDMRQSSLQSYTGYPLRSKLGNVSDCLAEQVGKIVVQSQ